MENCVTPDLVKSISDMVGVILLGTCLLALLGGLPWQNRRPKSDDPKSDPDKK